EVRESEGKSDEEETRQKKEESFDLIPRTPEESEEESNDEDDQELRLGEEARIQEEEDTDELYRDININQGRGLQVTQNVEDSHVTLTPVNPDGPQESSSMSSFVTSMLNPTSDRLRSLETSFSEYRQTNPFVNAVSAFPEELVQTTCQMKEPSHPVFETGVDDQPIVQTSQHPVWFSQPRRPPSPNRAWNKTLPAAQRDAQSWISPLPLIPDNQGRRVILFEHFINNDLEYLRGGASSHKYTTSVTKTKAADYGHIKWIEDLVPRAMWIQQPIDYNKHALWGVSHWGRKRKQFYEYAVNRESAIDVYSKRRIIDVTELKIVEWHDYKQLDWILVHRDDDKIYKFKEGDLKRLCLQDIEDMLLLLVQGKLSNLTVEERFAFNVSLRMITRSIIIKRRVEDLQLGVESYRKRLSLTKPDTYRPDLKRREAYTAHSNPKGFIYQNKDKKNRLMRIDKLHKFSDGTLNDVRNTLDDRLKGI
nr:hypothetical protein [Tanacetum cinerariifolium]